MQLLTTIPCGNILGEGIIYDDLQDQLLWTDIQTCKLYRYGLTNGELEIFSMPSRVGSLALTTHANVLVIAFEQGVAKYNLQTTELQWLVKIEQHIKHTRLNDGRVDREGRFWVGSMVENHKLSPGQSDFEKGSLYRLDGPGAVTATINNLLITNSLCWSPDGAYMYHCDTPSQQINCYRMNQYGLPEAGKVLINTEPGCFPDGSTVDAEGYLWNAQWGGSQLVRYAPNGDLDYKLSLPISQPTCVCFAGKDFNLLAVTSAREGLSQQALANQPQAGNVLIYKTDYKGLPESRCQLK